MNTTPTLPTMIFDGQEYYTTTYSMSYDVGAFPTIDISAIQVSKLPTRTAETLKILVDVLKKMSASDLEEFRGRNLEYFL